jgi:hypothetical protein
LADVKVILYVGDYDNYCGALLVVLLPDGAYLYALCTRPGWN